MNSNIAIHTNALTKRYGAKTACSSLELTVYGGETLALLGVNGAGKTTLIKMLSCLIPPTEGDAEIFGNSIVSNPEKVKSVIGVSPQETSVAPNLTVRENLEFIAEIYDPDVSKAKEKAEEMIVRFEFGEYSNTRAKKLSGGWQRRLSIAMALISKPKLLFLDEPTLGLDILARRELWKHISALKGKTTVILTTHYLEEAEALSDRIAIMSNGVIKNIGTAEELITISGEDNFENAFVKLATEH